MLETITHLLADEYDRRNNDGEGYAVGEETDTIDKIDGLGALLDHDPRRSLALYTGTGAGPVLVGGDWQGRSPWAVTLYREE